MKVIDFEKSSEQHLFMKPGLYRMHEEDYRRSIAINISKLNHLDKSPAHLIHNDRFPIQTEAMSFGKFFHLYLLEPDRFEKEVRISPDFGDQRSKKNKEFKAEWLEENKGFDCVQEPDFKKFQQMMESIFSTKQARGFIEKAREKALVEIALYSEDQETKLMKKGRIDCIVPLIECIIDLKTTQDASPGGFSKSNLNFKYYRQAAYYKDLLDEIDPFSGIDKYIYVVVESKAPYGVACYEVPKDNLEIGRIEYLKHLKTYQECLKTNKWPSYEDIVTPLHLPKWYTRRYEE